jgi:hypothetical protein
MDTLTVMFETLVPFSGLGGRPAWHDLVHVLWSHGYSANTFVFGVGVSEEEKEGEVIVTLDAPTFGLERDQLAGGGRKVVETDRFLFSFWGNTEYHLMKD